MPRPLSPRPIASILVCAAASALCACSGSGDSPSAGGADTGLSALPSDAVIMGKVYATTVSVPSDFFVDSTREIATPHTLYHVKSTDVDVQAAVPYELCSDDYAAALQWSETSAQGRAHNGALLSTTETDEYFEFLRTLDGLGDWTSYERVFKCTYVDRTGTDLRTASGPAGRVNRAPLSAASLKNLVEYLWHFSGYNNPGHAVLASTSFTAPGTLGHTLTLAAVQRGAGAVAGCDALSVTDWRFSVDTASGDMTATVATVLRFDSTVEAGVPRRCGA